MMHRDDQPLKYHEDVGLFRETLTFTESATGFSSRLVEKDYYCSILLHDLAPAFQQEMAFKGGTCLSKVHTDFYRLSEDLDFVIPTAINALRSDRRTKIATLRDHLAGLPKRLACFHIAEPLQGFNLSKQYIGRYAYRSLVTGQDEFIKVEIGMREPLLDPVEQRLARTMLTDPFRNESAIGPIPVNVLSIREAYAEKFRAALTRREPAIRDFYDIDYAVRTSILAPADDRLLELVRQKLAVPDNDPIDVSEEKLVTLHKQLATQLKPVLRATDYMSFDLERAFGIVVKLVEAI
jgi:predicted nucleotidyltransferase component of viral defense system